VQVFRGLVKILEERGEFYRISRSVEPKFEMPAVMEQIEQQTPKRLEGLAPNREYPG
jgi:3-polyprenyl-4-hydroxybenzoate decarboxylase